MSTLSVTSISLALKEDRPLWESAGWEVLDAKDLHSLLQNVCTEIAPSKDSLRFLDRFVEKLSLEQIQATIRISYPEHIDALQTAREMVESAKSYLEIVEGESSPTSRTHYTKFLNPLLTIVENTFQGMLEPTKSYLETAEENSSSRTRCGVFLDSLVATIESILAAFGIAELFKPAENEVKAEFRRQKLMMLISIFSMVSAMLIPLIGGVVVSIGILSVLFSIALLSVIYPFIRPNPSELPRAENFTQQIREGKLNVSRGRKEIFDQIANALISSKKVKAHPLLLGPSGVGKTETLKAFAAAIEQGHYPELQGKTVFYFNTATLLANSGMFSDGNKILGRIYDLIGRHKEGCILVFDEIHMAYEKREKGSIADELKILLDPRNEKFPYVVGITTEKEFYRNEAVMRRFQKIVMGSTNAEETTEILQRVLIKDAPFLFVEKDALKHLVDKTKSEIQPAASLKILSKCIQKTSALQTSSLETHVEETRKKIQAHRLQGAIGHTNVLLPYKKAPTFELEHTLLQLKEQLHIEKERRETLFATREALSSLKTETFKTVLKVAQYTQTSLSNHESATLSKFLLMSHYLAPAMEQWIKREAQELHIQTTLSSQLIDETIAEEISSEERAQKMLSEQKSA